jgi:diguanylate cyclase (GGDEF)-like protein
VPDTFTGRFLPRDTRSAAIFVAVLAWVAVVTNITFALTDPDGIDPIAFTIAVVSGVFIGGVGVWVRVARTVAAVVWTVVPFTAIAAIVVIDLRNQSASTAAQIYLSFPVLYAASQLRRFAAAAVTATALAGEVVVVVGQLSPVEAVLCIGYVGSALVATAVLLVLAAERQERLVIRLRRLAAVDPLTGLVTRTVLFKAAQDALDTDRPTDGVALVLLDVDDFKAINDGFGHPVGDEVLVRLGGLLMASTRPNDVVSRLGGDELAVLMPGCSLAACRTRVQELQTRIRREPFRAPDGSPVPVSISAGIAHAPTSATDLHDLYATADAALYAAKRGGKDRFAVSP